MGILGWEGTVHDHRAVYGLRVQPKQLPPRSPYPFSSTTNPRSCDFCRRARQYADVSRPKLQSKITNLLGLINHHRKKCLNWSSLANQGTIWSMLSGKAGKNWSRWQTRKSWSGLAKIRPDRKAGQDNTWWYIVWQRQEMIKSSQHKNWSTLAKTRTDFSITDRV